MENVNDFIEKIKHTKFVQNNYPDPLSHRIYSNENQMIAVFCYAEEKDHNPFSIDLVFNFKLDFQNDKIIPLMYVCYFNKAEIIHIEEESTMKEIMDYVCNNHFIEESIINVELPKKTILEFFRNILSDEYILKLNLKQEE